jgi:hypothetical protein
MRNAPGRVRTEIGTFYACTRINEPYLIFAHVTTMTFDASSNFYETDSFFSSPI